MDKDKFVQDLKRVATRLFKEAEAKYDIYEFGIMTDQDCRTIVLGFNTYEYFVQPLSDSTLNAGFTANMFRWMIPEWFAELGNNDTALDELSDRFGEIIDIEYERGNEMYKDDALDILLRCLLEMREEGVFKSMKDDFILYIDRVDSWINESMRRRIKQLLNEKQYAKFEQDMKKDFI